MAESYSNNEERVWYVEVDGAPSGPFHINEIIEGLKDDRFTKSMLAYGPGMTKWDPIEWIPELSTARPKLKPAFPKSTFHQDQLAHDIQFEIHGSEMQYVEISLDPAEAAFAEANSLLCMDAQIHMETDMNVADENRNLIDQLGETAARLLQKDKLCLTVFTNRGQSRHNVSFGAPYAGQVVPYNLAEMGGEIICQRESFLCAAKGVTLSIAFQQKIQGGPFGREGFVLERLKGNGLAFLHTNGPLVSRELQRNEAIKVDAGRLVAMEPEVQFDLEYAGKVKSELFGSDGYFYLFLQGPGTVWLQTIPMRHDHDTATEEDPTDKGSQGRKWFGRH